MPESTTTEPETAGWLTLDADEETVWSGKPHKSSLIPALIVGIPLSFVLIGLFIIAGTYLQRENTHYVVTTDGLYKKTGILSRDVQRIDFDKVQNTSYSQGFFGSQFGYGNVDVSTAGGSGIEMQFRSAPDPREVQELINKRVKRSRGEPTTESGETKRDVLDEILGELKAIRSTLDGQQAATRTESATTSATDTAAGDRSPGEDTTSRTDLVGGGQSDENAPGDRESDGER